MIGIDYASGLFFYVLIWFVTIAILWARELWRNRAYSWEASNRHLLTCPNCHVSFLSGENANVERCPRCNAICFYRKR